MSKLERISSDKRNDYNSFLSAFKHDFNTFSRLDKVKMYNLTIKNTKNIYIDKFKIVSIDNIKIGYILFNEFDQEYNFILLSDTDQNVNLEDQEYFIFEYATKLTDLITLLCANIDFNKLYS